VTGAAGQLGRQLVKVFEAGGDEVLPLSRPLLDLDDPRAAVNELTRVRPEVVVHAAAWTDVDGCARDPEAAMRRNGSAAGSLSTAAAAWGALFVQISTNEVFDGKRAHPYEEDVPPAPINPYGASKLAGELAVQAATPHHLIVRTAWLFGPGGTNFVTKMIAAAHGVAASGDPLRVVEDEWGNPTWAPSLATAIVDAIGRAPQTGIHILHLAGSPATSRYEWAEAIVSALAEPSPPLARIRSADYPRASQVPNCAVLSGKRARSLGIGPLEWREATADYVRSQSRAAPP
jgi:dTDP-4-dehydrorhamnose reductase